MWLAEISLGCASALYGLSDMLALKAVGCQDTQTKSILEGHQWCCCNKACSQAAVPTALAAPAACQ